MSVNYIHDEPGGEIIAISQDARIKGILQHHHENGYVLYRTANRTLAVSSGVEQSWELYLKLRQMDTATDFQNRPVAALRRPEDAPIFQVKA